MQVKTVAKRDGEEAIETAQLPLKKRLKCKNHNIHVTYNTTFQNLMVKIKNTNFQVF